MLPSSLCCFCIALSHGFGSSSWVAAAEKVVLIPASLQSAWGGFGEGLPQRQPFPITDGGEKEGEKQLCREQGWRMEQGLGLCLCFQQGRGKDGSRALKRWILQEVMKKKIAGVAYLGGGSFQGLPST